MVNHILKKYCISPIYSIGDAVILSVLLTLNSYKIRVIDLSLELLTIGARSLLIVIISAWFVGMVLALQISSVLHNYGSDVLTGAVVALALVKELGAVLCAFLFIARVGTGISSQIAIMKITEQLTAMELMNINPLERVYAPKFLASLIALPILTNLFNSVAILASYFVCKFILHNNTEFFFWHIIHKIDFYMVGISLIKSMLFSIIISLVCIYQGSVYVENSDGVVKTNANTVFITVVMVLICDFIVTSLALK